MRLLAIMLVTFLVAIWPARGDDQLPELKVGDTVYSNVSILRVTATDICFSCSSGIFNVKLTSLDPASQARFAPDAAKAGEAEKAQEQANAQYLAAVAVRAIPPPAPEAEVGTPTVATNSSTTNKPPAKSFLDRPGPELSAEKWLSAAPNTQGKFVLINFWATTNAPSVSFIPKLNGFQDQFTTNLAVIGISHESEDDVRKIEEPGIQYSSAIDTQGQMETAIELKKLPYALLMDTNQIVRWEGNPLNSTNALTENVVAKILEKYSQVQ
jgi:cytochrome c biogenesis protein CcmG, thiol:disulfide interchange protein DsbE